MSLPIFTNATIICGISRDAAACEVTMVILTGTTIHTRVGVTLVGYWKIARQTNSVGAELSRADYQTPRVYDFVKTKVRVISTHVPFTWPETSLKKKTRDKKKKTILNRWNELDVHPQPYLAFRNSAWKCVYVCGVGGVRVRMGCGGSIPLHSQMYKIIKNQRLLLYRGHLIDVIFYLVHS